MSVLPSASRSPSDATAVPKKSLSSSVPVKEPAVAADLLMGFDRAVGVEEQHPHRAAIGPPSSSTRRAYDCVAHAVGIEVTDVGHRGTEEVVVVERAGEASRQIADLLLGGNLPGEGGRITRREEMASIAKHPVTSAAANRL
jgi:hypothetical protein